jgi:hypothetical protein
MLWLFLFLHSHSQNSKNNRNRRGKKGYLRNKTWVVTGDEKILFETVALISLSPNSIFSIPLASCLAFSHTDLQMGCVRN